MIMSEKEEEIKSNESYDKMAESLDSTFKGEKVIQKEIVKSEKTSDALAKIDMLTLGLEDASYMAAETRDNIEGLNFVMSVLKDEMKVGAKPRMFEVYATLSNSKTNAMKELRELKKIILDHKDKKYEKNGTPTNVTVNMMTPRKMMEMISQAKEVNTMKEIDATFNVKEEKNGR